ncbi:DUF5694 domain-containing protein [Hellea sp.]|nr:DUF5694 domain-containing protein [Hellea sp.]
MKRLLGLLAMAATLASCNDNNTSLNFSGVDPALTVPPTQVMVLGTSHLSNYKDDLSLEDLEPLLARLEAYAPDVITIEASSGMTCQRVRAYPLEHDGYADRYCFDSAPYLEESGLTVVEGSYQARKALLDWPDQPTAAQRRSLAAAFIASGEPESALVQWLRLSPADRVEGDGLGVKSVDLMTRASQRLNESYSIAAKLAARRGLERVFHADDHGSWLDSKADDKAYSARLSELWPGEDDPCQANFNDSDAKLTGGDIIGAYRMENSKAWQHTRMSCDFKRTMNDDQPEGYGRKYTMGWEARNLRMVSLIMIAATTKPGGRVLSIVGSSHKPYQEAYLDQMHDVEIVSTDTVLD